MTCCVSRMRSHWLECRIRTAKRSQNVVWLFDRPVCLSACLSVCALICLPDFPRVRLWICRSKFVSVCLSVRHLVCRSAYFLVYVPPCPCVLCIPFKKMLVLHHNIHEGGSSTGIFTNFYKHSATFVRMFLSADDCCLMFVSCPRRLVQASRER